jgi:hypothetical protein
MGREGVYCCEGYPEGELDRVEGVEEGREGVLVEGEVFAGDAWRSNDPPRARPPVFPLGEDFEGLLVVEEDLEELEELDERLLEEDLEELDEERLEEPPPLPLASALGKFNHSVISGVVGSIVT